MFIRKLQLHESTDTALWATVIFLTLCEEPLCISCENQCFSNSPKQDTIVQDSYNEIQEL